jgi:hypothetical protein
MTVSGSRLGRRELRHASRLPADIIEHIVLRMHWERPQKEKKTARELHDMLAQRFGLDGFHISVFKCPDYGWGAKVIMAPVQAIAADHRLQKIATELRFLYELKE